VFVAGGTKQRDGLYPGQFNQLRDARCVSTPVRKIDRLVESGVEPSRPGCPGRLRAQRVSYAIEITKCADRASQCRVLAAVGSLKPCDQQFGFSAVKWTVKEPKDFYALVKVVEHFGRLLFFPIVGGHSRVEGELRVKKVRPDDFK